MMENGTYPEAIQQLISYLSHLPGIGRRTAERLALAMMKWPGEQLTAFGDLLVNLRHKAGYCPVCGNFADAGETCCICQDANRRGDIICVVDEVSQIQAIERSGSYNGLYHVLGGKLSPMDGIGPKELKLAQLEHRLESGAVQELLLAISPDVEGEATAHYIAQQYARPGLSITRIASGVPIGSELAYADSATVATAIMRRHQVKE